MIQTSKNNNKIIFREVNGVFILNKDLNASSNRALQQVRRLFRAAKAGHTGSLDPLATGVLPICFGEATKFASYLLDSDKTYEVTAKLGVVTTTDDCEGEVIATSSVPSLTMQQMQDVINGFIGCGTQVPSMFSALKHNGQPLYKLARQGINIERPAREITIHNIQILEYNHDILSLEVACSKGTYIRTLVADIGAKLGCGAHVIRLHRTKAAYFNIAQAYSYPDLQQLSSRSTLDEVLLPVKCLLKSLPQVMLNTVDAAYLSNGRSIIAPQGIYPGDFCLVNETEELLGVGTALNDGRMVAKRMMSPVKGC